MRWKRRRYLWRAFRSRHALRSVTDNTDQISTADILLFATMRDEAIRLPHFLDHYRALGVTHFLIVDNGSTDGTAEQLARSPDVSLWQSANSYKASRFGMDWINHLLRRYGSGHWCITVDTDEILTYPDWPNLSLGDLTARLDRLGLPNFGALMVDLYPKGRLADQSYAPGQDPFETLRWLDRPDFTAKRQEPVGNLWVQGGVRRRVFFADSPARAPTLNKIPLVKWRRAFAYVNSTHSMLPRALNAAYYDFDGKRMPSGALLHTKFLDLIVARSGVEKARGEHFGDGRLFTDYYDALSSNPDLWFEHSIEYQGWKQLEDLGVIKGTT